MRKKSIFEENVENVFFDRKKVFFLQDISNTRATSIQSMEENFMKEISIFFSEKFFGENIERRRNFSKILERFSSTATIHHHDLSHLLTSSGHIYSLSLSRSRRLEKREIFNHGPWAYFHHLTCFLMGAIASCCCQCCCKTSKKYR